MTISKSAAPTHDRVPELDLLRFIAATLVVFYHYTYRPAINGVASETTFGAMQDVFRYGYLGVQLFFLISGFVILWSAEDRTVKQFATSRFLRLYPMFWMGMSITLAVLFLAGWADQFASVSVILANLTLVPAYFKAPLIDGVYWTLVIELKFYVMIAFAILLGQMKRIEFWMYVWLAGSIAATFVESLPILKSLTMLPHGLYFVGGAVAYFIRSRGLNATRGIALVLCAGFSVFHADADRFNFTSPGQLASVEGVTTLIVLFYGVLFAIAMKRLQLPSAKLLFSLGALTYPLYLLHNMIGKVIFAWAQPRYGAWIGLLLIVAIAYSLAYFCATRVEPFARARVASWLGLFTRSKVSKTSESL